MLWALVGHNEREGIMKFYLVAKVKEYNCR